MKSRASSLLGAIVFLFCALGSVPLTKAADSFTVVFRGELAGYQAVGYLKLDGQPWALGRLYFAGEAWPLVKLAGDGRYGWPNYWHDEMCLLIDPFAPRIRGLVYWSGLRGAINWLSTDGRFGEMPLTVLRLENR